MSLPSKKKLRISGFLFSALFGVLFGIFPYLFHNDFRLFIFIISGVITLISLFSPYSLKIPYSIWIKFGMILGIINSNLILFFFFYVLITPFAILRKLILFITKSFNKENKSYYSKKLLSKKINFKDQI